MGYSIYITRGDNWCTGRGPFITAEEWTNVIANDPDLVPLENIPLSAYIAFADPDSYNRAAARFWLDVVHGNLMVTKPNREELMKMLQVARVLHARVIGEDGEIYDNDGNPDRFARFVVTDGKS